MAITSSDTKLLLEFITGVKYPAANDAKMRMGSAELRNIANMLREYAPQIEKMLRNVQGNLKGETEGAFYGSVAPYALTEPKLLYSTADMLEGSGRYLDEMALEVDYLKR